MRFMGYRKNHLGSSGKPEFYIKIVGIDDNYKTIELAKQLDFRFEHRKDANKNFCQTFRNRKIIDWEYSSESAWYSILTIYMEEYDRSTSKAKFNASAKYNKIMDSMGLEISTGPEVEVEFSDKGEDCGCAYTNFYDNTEYVLEFPNYGARVKISKYPE